MDIPAGKYDVRVIAIVVDVEGNAHVQMITHGPGAGVTFMFPVTTVGQYEAEAKLLSMGAMRTQCVSMLITKFGSDSAWRYIEAAEDDEGVEYWKQFFEVIENAPEPRVKFIREALLDDMGTFLEALDEA